MPYHTWLIIISWSISVLFFFLLFRLVLKKTHEHVAQCLSSTFISVRRTLICIVTFFQGFVARSHRHEHRHRHSFSPFLSCRNCVITSLTCFVSHPHQWLSVTNVTGVVFWMSSNCTFCGGDTVLVMIISTSVCIEDRMNWLDNIQTYSCLSLLHCLPHLSRSFVVSFFSKLSPADTVALPSLT